MKKTLVVALALMFGLAIMAAAVEAPVPGGSEGGPAPKMAPGETAPEPGMYKPVPTKKTPKKKKKPKKLPRPRAARGPEEMTSEGGPVPEMAPGEGQAPDREKPAPAKKGPKKHRKAPAPEGAPEHPAPEEPAGN